MAVSGKTSTHEVPYFLGTDKPPDMAAVTKAIAERVEALLSKGGDVSIAADGTVTIGAGKVTRGKLSGALIQTKRVETPELAAGESKEVTVTWPVAFSDALYTVGFSCQSEGLGAGVFVRWYKTKLAASIIVVVKNDSGGGLKGTINATAIHD